MRERLVTLACALGALALFYVMFIGTARAPDPSRAGVVRPASVERRANGYFGASEWLARSGVRVVSLRERFTALAGPELGLAPRGNLLIVTLPGVQGIRTEELLPLDRWIRAGNTLLVMAALGDRPDWAQATGTVSTDDLAALTGLSVEPAAARDRRLRGEASEADPAGEDAIEALRGVPREGVRLAEPRRTTLVANRAHAYFEGVRTVAALSDYPSSSWVVRVPYDTFFLALARTSDRGDDALWTRRLGAGRIIVSGFASLFTNRALGLEDNARLLANVAATNVAADGTVLFDDLRQGLAASYDPAQFFSDPRLYWTVAILLGLWLAWVLGGTRLRTPAAAMRVPRETDLIRAGGEFLARVLPVRAAARTLYEHFFAGLRARLGLPRNGEPPWDWLERHPRIAREDLERLKAGYAAAHGSGRVRLVPLRNLLLHIDRLIS